MNFFFTIKNLRTVRPLLKSLWKIGKLRNILWPEGISSTEHILRKWMLLLKILRIKIICEPGDVKNWECVWKCVINYKCCWNIFITWVMDRTFLFLKKSPRIPAIGWAIIAQKWGIDDINPIILIFMWLISIMWNSTNICKFVHTSIVALFISINLWLPWINWGRHK